MDGIVYESGTIPGVDTAPASSTPLRLQFSVPAALEYSAALMADDFSIMSILETMGVCQWKLPFGFKVVAIHAAFDASFTNPADTLNTSVEVHRLIDGSTVITPIAERVIDNTSEHYYTLFEDFSNSAATPTFPEVNIGTSILLVNRTPATNAGDVMIEGIQVTIVIEKLEAV